MLLALAGPQPPSSALVWQAYLCGLHLCALAAFTSLLPQVRLFAHPTKGISPPRARLAKARHDLGLRAALHIYPTWLWLVGTSDAAVHAVCLCGMAASVLGLFQLVPTSASLLLVWSCYLSLDAAVFELHLPWDQVLMEASFWSAFLPAQPARFIVRVLFARLMLGFARTKFAASSWSTSALYIREFLVAMPLPTRAGLLGARVLPAVAFYQMLATMFVSELCAPLLGLVPFTPMWVRASAFGLAANLMFGIGLTGSFGHFNAVTIVLALPQLVPMEEDFSAWALPYVAAGLVQAGFGSGLSNVWPWFLDELLRRRPSWAVRAIAGVFRATGPLRIANAYGVFPPHSFFPGRSLPVFEIRVDGQWSPVSLPYLPSSSAQTPPLVHPGLYLHTPRLDMKLYYWARGMWCVRAPTRPPA
jgi:hypothetical protein